jgi:outer membrane protein TolC
MYAANRAIGVARAARFPQISLGGNGGFQSMAVSSLISAPNAFWAVGPQFSLPIFDGADQGADRSRKGRLGRGQRQLSRQRITGHARG